MLEDVVQISFGNMTYVGRKVSAVGGDGPALSGQYRGEASVAYWRLYKPAC